MTMQNPERVVTKQDLRDFYDGIYPYLGGGSGGGGGGSTTLSGLTDTDIDTPTDGQVLAYNNSTRKWENSNVGGGTGDYTDLTNKPSINNVTLSGNKTTSDLGISYNDLSNKPTIPSTADCYKTTDDIGTTIEDGDKVPYYNASEGGKGNVTWIEIKSVLKDYFDDIYSTVDDINDLSDVNVTTPTSGQVLKYDSASSKWINAAESGGGGGSTTKAITAAIDVGGIEAGTTYPMGTDLETIISDLLEPTLYPTLTAPSASITYGANQYYAVGATVSAMDATVALNRGTIAPSYGTSGYRSGAATGYAIATTGADTEYSDSSENSGTFNIPALTRATKGTIVVTGTASYAAGEQPKDSKGNDYQTALAAGSVTASKTLTFIQPYYYGVANSSTISDLTGLTASVTAKGNKTFSYTTNNQYMVFAYDSSYGNLKNIVDGNGFDVTGGWTKSSLTVDGFSYFVYVANSPTTDTNAPFTFKY